MVAQGISSREAGNAMVGYLATGGHSRDDMTIVINSSLLFLCPENETYP